MTGFSRQTEGDRVQRQSPEPEILTHNCWEHGPLADRACSFAPPHLCHVIHTGSGRPEEGRPGPGSAGRLPSLTPRWRLPPVSPRCFSTSGRDPALTARATYVT